MKIPSLLAHYLYCYLRLDLPGIGTFLLDRTALSTLENSKQRSALLEGVSFENNPSLKESPELIAFIAQKTGKMKALAAADLDSHLRLVEQFLNIGKPFSFEGIGILAKEKPGVFEFTPITVSTEKVREYSVRESDLASPKEPSSEVYESFLSSPITNSEWKRPVLALFLACGVAITIWGGYTISKKAGKHKMASLTESSTMAAAVAPAPDSNLVQSTDSVKTAGIPLSFDNNYKYVLEIAKSKRAFKRYNQLRSIQWKVQLETKDSVQYKLFMLLPAVSDTSRTIDSLTVMSGRKVYIEYPSSTDQRKLNL